MVVFILSPDFSFVFANWALLETFSLVQEPVILAGPTYMVFALGAILSALPETVILPLVMVDFSPAAGEVEQEGVLLTLEAGQQVQAPCAVLAARQAGGVQVGSLVDRSE